MEKFDSRSYANSMAKLRLMEDLFEKAMKFIRVMDGKELIGLGNNLGYGDFKISYAFKGVRSIGDYLSDREEMPDVGDYLMVFKTDRKVSLDDPMTTIPSIVKLATSQGMGVTLPKMAKAGLLEVSLYDDGQRLAVLWPKGYCTNEPDLALKIGGEIYGMRMEI